MRIIELLTEPSRTQKPPPVETDALTQSDALMEAALLDLRLDTTTADLWLLFDCRGALQLQDGNTAVVVVHNVGELSWMTTPRGKRTWRAVMSWEPINRSGVLSISAEFEPTGRLAVVGSGGEFYVGNIPGGDEPPPDFTRATDEQIRHGLANWYAEFDVVGAAYL